MVYKCYTDGSCSKTQEVVSSAYYVYTDTNYITSGVGVSNRKYIVCAECAAVGNALRDLQKVVELKEDDLVKIFIDSKKAIEVLEHVDNPEELDSIRYDSLVVMAFKELKKIRNICKYELIKVKAHRGGFSGNTAADRLAKYALRMKIRGED